MGFGPPLSTPSTAVRRNIANTANTNIQVRENTSITTLTAGQFLRVRDITAVDVADALTFAVSYYAYTV